MLLQILLPMTVPALVTTGTVYFCLNEFIFAPHVYDREELKTIPRCCCQLGGASVFVLYGPLPLLLF